MDEAQPQDAMSVCLWVEDNNKNVYHYQKYGKTDMDVVVVPKDEEVPFFSSADSMATLDDGLLWP